MRRRSQLRTFTFDSLEFQSVDVDEIAQMKMTQEAAQIIEVPNLGPTTDGMMFTPKQWLERLREYTKRKSFSL